MEDEGNPTVSPEGTPPPKRKLSEGPQQQRAKRNRYISIACNECKRRKIKCNGQTPCHRCGNLQLECLYAPNCCNNFKDSKEFKDMLGHISSLQKQVDTLFSNMNALRSQIDSQTTPPVGSSPYSLHSLPRSISTAQPSNSASSGLSHARYPSNVQLHPNFRGPTSSAFNIGVAKTSLQNMGITEPDEGLEEGGTTQDGTPSVSPQRSQSSRLNSSECLKSHKDAIWMINKPEAIRLLNFWYDEMGTMYPLLDIDRVMKHASRLYDFVDAARRTGLMEPGMRGADAIHDDNTILLKLLIAIAMILEGSGKSDPGQKMFDGIRPQIEGLLFNTPTIQGVRILALSAMYSFHRDDEGAAWRMIGAASLMCIELGLHRHETYSQLFSTEEEKMAGVDLFWSVYVLDRRWSFGTGLPFTIQDADLDPMLIKPAPDATPYLAAMVAYSIIGTRVWQRVANLDAQQAGDSVEEVSYLDYQVLQWQNNLPDSLTYIAPGAAHPNPPTSRNNQRLRIILYLRANQMRIVIYRPVLHTSTSIAERMSHAKTAVAVAQDTIRVLTLMNQTTNFYRSHQVMFNYFLVSALAVLFLAVAHAPVEFSSCCRDEFYMALDLVRGMSADSYVSKRLWKMIKMLKDLGPRLGLNVRNTALDPVVDAHSTAAVAMAGLAGHQVDEMALYANGTSGIAMNNDSPNGMANDLTSLFEAAGGSYAGIMAGGSGGGYMTAGPGADGVSGEGLGSVFGNQDEISRILGSLFR
ncbi:fungal-specific transcription factor domain protein [Trichodelitschia bisporula]|uniref:Fungal-specific transcription factor domain protein n=1 Tax=Trichodelitschia bisporula TaxID=703511 RepID=A0A6G1I008_9PEZI|nr:fungal-specific transcription factor domain protein [Trichodelitschia bisporula]